MLGIRSDIGDEIGLLREQYAARRRVVVENLFGSDFMDQVAEELYALPFEPIANVPLKGETPGRPRLWFHHCPVVVDPRKPLSPLRELVYSMTRGEILSLVRAVTARARLRDEYENEERPGLVAYAYPRGGFIEEHIDGGGADRRSVALVFYGSREWEPSWGGELRFTVNHEDNYFPKFGALCFFDVGAHNKHSVTMITGPRVRYSVAGFLLDGPP